MPITTLIAKLPDLYHDKGVVDSYILYPHLLTWINFNPSMDM